MHLVLINGTVLFIWNSYGREINNSFLSVVLMKSLSGSSNYTGALPSASPQGWFALSRGAPEMDPAAGLCRRAAALYLFKSPDLILRSSCLRSGRSGREAEAGEAHRPAGADRRADVVKSGSTGIKSWA